VISNTSLDVFDTKFAQTPFHTGQVLPTASAPVETTGRETANALPTEASSSRQQ
jgi:hypothetical protein